jgi:hypothetical protein
MTAKVFESTLPILKDLAEADSTAMNSPIEFFEIRARNHAPHRGRYSMKGAVKSGRRPWRDPLDQAESCE